MGLLAAHIASEEISAVAGNTGKISHCLVRTLKVRIFPRMVGVLRKYPCWVGAGSFASEKIAAVQYLI